jgi:hypothetical protein
MAQANALILQLKVVLRGTRPPIWRRVLVPSNVALDRFHLEAVHSADKGMKYPCVLAGKRACPPEDVGGVWGYENFLGIIRDPKHPEHDDTLAWCGDSFDPEAFDIGAVNRAFHGG